MVGCIVYMNQTCASISIPAAADQRLELLMRLEDALDTRALAAVIAQWVENEYSCRAATVVWRRKRAVKMETEPATELDEQDLGLVCSAAERVPPVASADGNRLAIRLFEASGAIPSAVLLLVVDEPADGLRLAAELSLPLEIAGRQLRRALELADLQAKLKRLERSESLQRALFAISDLAASDRDMREMLHGVHTIVGELMYAQNFYIVWHDAERDSLRFLYYVDIADPEPPGDDVEIAMSSIEHSLTWHLLRSAKPLMGSTEQLRTQVPGPLAIWGPHSQDWLGVPMLRDGHAHGAIVVQSYEQRGRFSADDRTLLEFVGSHILVALERKRSKQDLEHQVRVRTTELAAANQVLQREIAERQHAERLQAALFQIAQLAMADIDRVEFCRRVHSAIGPLINAENFYIALVSDDRASLDFAYFIDKIEQQRASRSLAAGLSEYVLRTGPALLRTAEIMDLARRGEIDLQTLGPVAACWLGVPLMVNEKTIGLIVVQSYDEAIIYGPADQELLSFVASQVANSLNRRRSAEDLREAYATLKQRIEERTQELYTRNAELEIAYAKLKSAQEQAIQSEKLASIGQLAAGVAHEINNPIGYVNSNLATLQGYVARLLSGIESYGAITRNSGAATAAASEEIRRRIDLAYLVVDVPQLITESRDGIDRVCKIIRDLKDFSRHDRGEAWANVDIHQLLESTLNIVSNQLKYKAEIVKTFGDLPLIECLPSELNQVFLNVLMNAGQAIEERGMITVSTGYSGDMVWIAIGDDGGGIPEDVLPRIFDPFFTTKPVGSGTGLGLSISYGIVTKHHGNIEITSVIGQGTLVRIDLPVRQPS
jgi:signal transduction histidine kinase